MLSASTVYLCGNTALLEPRRIGRGSGTIRLAVSYSQANVTTKITIIMKKQISSRYYNYKRLAKDIQKKRNLLLVIISLVKVQQNSVLYLGLLHLNLTLVLRSYFGAFISSVRNLSEMR